MSDLREFLQEMKPSDRKLRLFAVACCRQIWRSLNDRLRGCVQLAEDFADGKVELEDLANVRSNLSRRLERPVRSQRVGARTSSIIRAVWTTCGTPRPSWCDTPLLAHIDCIALERIAGYKRCLELAADILYPATVSYRPSVPAKVFTMAEQIYEHRAFAELPILADMIDEFAVAQAEDAYGEKYFTDIAEHFRGQGTHYRGCWGLDCLLGKK